MPTDSRLNLSGLAALQAETLGCPDVCVAVLDGPADLSRPAFRGANVSSLDTVVSLSQGDVDRTHGTHVASLVFGQPDSEAPGVAPRIRGLVVPVHASRPDSTHSSTSSNPPDLARGIREALENGAHVVMLHGGALSPDEGMLDALAKALARAAERNVLVVVAAEGDGNEHFHVPTAASTVLAVAAEDADGKLLDFGMWGPTYRDSGIVAPAAALAGVKGASAATYAAAMVAGIAGLFLSRQVARGKPADPRAVRAALLQSTKPLSVAAQERGKGVLRGRLDIEAASKLV